VYPSPDFESKICTRDELALRVKTLQRPLVFTNGCFDVLHRGHVTYLAQARALGAAMVLGVNSDASVKRQGKGEDRPINAEEDRLAVLAALASVDLVVVFDEDTPLNLIIACQPEILVKGGDWAPNAIVGAKEVLNWGGSVHSIPFLHQRSTTALLKKIRLS
jgi:D-glycero-beta-D-manno-heptose 1-phosphate adenylyltransferase